MKCNRAIREWYADLMSTEYGRKSFRVLVAGSVMLPVLASSFHRLPSGHVAVIQNIFGIFGEMELHFSLL